MQLPASFRMGYERADYAQIVSDAGYEEAPGVRLASWAHQALGALCHMRFYEHRNIYDYQLQETRRLDEPHFRSVFHYRRPSGELVLANIDFDNYVAIPNSAQLDVWRNKSDWDEVMAVGDVLLRSRVKYLGITPASRDAEVIMFPAETTAPIAPAEDSFSAAS